MLIRRQLAAAVVVGFGLGACTSTGPKDSPQEPTAGQVSGVPQQPSGTTSGREGVPFVAEMVHFAFDSSVLRPGARKKLNDLAEYLKSNTDVRTGIDGHCDERGTVEYNLALGLRRAQSVKDYLVALGVEASRLRTKTYGKEKPLDEGHNSEAWALNRRAEFDLR